MIQDISYEEYNMSAGQYSHQFETKRPLIYIHMAEIAVYMQLDLYPRSGSHYALRIYHSL